MLLPWLGLDKSHTDPSEYDLSVGFGATSNMKSKVYLETTIVSYLTAEPSRDVVQAAHQQLTREWWDRECASTYSSRRL